MPTFLPYVQGSPSFRKAVDARLDAPVVAVSATRMADTVEQGANV